MQGGVAASQSLSTGSLTGIESAQAQSLCACAQTSPLLSRPWGRRHPEGYSSSTRFPPRPWPFSPPILSSTQVGWAGSGSVCEFQSGHGGVSVQGTGVGRQIRGHLPGEWTPHAVSLRRAVPAPLRGSFPGLRFPIGLDSVI
ncbi:COMM domain-containing protein 6 isoform X3 [Alexandromys fortis]|uniref:uncharacterized protein isoform X1 n=1 Tax=Alexandromys fortis TaxID=100897 RepID=UPI002152044C|nr:uncharacterized protein LOC126496213 isoform X1 [Microtus fortis]XP_050000608.1 COMM domain-containing protein 6 isoform X3 [Microtus fortis]